MVGMFTYSCNGVDEEGKSIEVLFHLFYDASRYSEGDVSKIVTETWPNIPDDLINLSPYQFDLYVKLMTEIRDQAIKSYSNNLKGVLCTDNGVLDQITANVVAETFGGK